MIRWIVVGLLGLAGTAVVVVPRWWHRRRARRPGGSTSPASIEGSGAAGRVERSATVVAGALMVGLALFVALVPMGSDPALLVLALGATIGTAGFAVASPLTRRGVRPGR